MKSQERGTEKLGLQVDQKGGPLCVKSGTINIYLDHDTSGLRLDIMNPADKDGDYVNISLFE